VDEEAAREAERRALFEELAKRPDTICPFLGLADKRTEYSEAVTDEHRCYAFGDPAELSAEQQQKVCLQRGYGNCPRYLRGVLVIPTEELEALRRPAPDRPPPPPPRPAPAPAGGGGRRGIVAAALVLLLMAGGGLGAFVLLNKNDGVAQQTPTPSGLASPSASTSVSTVPSESASSAPSTGPTPSPTPLVLPSTLPTPEPGDVPTGYAVVVGAGQYPVMRMDAEGVISEAATATFSGRSGAPVQRIEVDGVLYWRTLQGLYTGLAYSRDLSSAFQIYETYETADGEPRFRLLGEDEL
jgi:hypothetical protein